VRIAAVGTALPPHYYDQETLIEAFCEHWGGVPAIGRLAGLHRNVMVGGRYLALPKERYTALRTWGEANSLWVEAALDVGERAVRGALEAAGLGPGDVSALFFATITGVATPSIDALLMNRLGLPPHVKRVPIFGLGCVAGAAGIARAADYVRAFPDEVAVLLSVELCSLTLQREDLSLANLIASGLFGDGAAAVVVTGARRPARGPRVVATRSVFYPETEGLMGWKISERGFGIILSSAVPELVRLRLGPDVDEFLRAHDLARGDIDLWIGHPGGPKVLEAVRESLGIDNGALDLAWKSLREVGNLSSASVLFVLGDTLALAPAPGSRGLLFAMGPGFCSELVLLEW